jgi:hypothetical protein
MTMTRVPPGTPAPPSDYGEAAMLTEARGIDEAGTPVPPGIPVTQAQWDAESQAQQQAIISEFAARGTLTPAQAYAAQASVLTPAQQAAIGSALSAAGGCPPGYINLGGGEFPNHCVPAPSPNTGPSPTPSPPPQRRLTLHRGGGGGSSPLPPAWIASPSPITMDRASPGPAPFPSGGQGGAGGGGGGVPWGTLAVGGAVLAFLYAGREKKKRRRH